MRPRFLLAIPCALAFAASALAGPTTPTAGPGAPRNCGPSPTKHHIIRVDAGSKCDFGLATWRALSDYDKVPGHIISGEERNFTLRPTYHGRKVRMDCRQLYRAHGELDFACNNLNYHGTRVVKFDNNTLP